MNKTRHLSIANCDSFTRFYQLVIILVNQTDGIIGSMKENRFLHGMKEGIGSSAS